jgi:lipoprotein NlpI
MTSKEAEMFYKQAMSCFGQGKVKKSLDFFDGALAVDDQYVPAWNDKGVALMDLEEYSQALQCFDQVIRLDAGDNMAWYNRGYVLLILEEYRESVNTLDLFLARYPKKDDFYKYALYLKAKGHYGLEEYEEANELLQKALKKDKTFKEARELLVLVLKDMKEEE